jgi:molybdopterin biosynthesis enzyme
MNNEVAKSDSVMFNNSLISADDALAFLLDSSIAASRIEVVSLDDSLDRVLAGNLSH